MHHRKLVSLAAVVAASLLAGHFAPTARTVYAPGPAAVTAEPWSAAPPSAARAAQDEDADGDEADPTDEIRDPVLRAKAKRIAELSEKLVGGWRLVSMRQGSGADPFRQVGGVLLVGESLASLTIHGQLDPQRLGRTGEVVQAGVHYWRIGQRETLEMATVLGHDNANEEGAVTREPSLEPREYEVTILGSRLVLSKRDGTRLEFDRFDVSAFPPDAARFIDALRQGRDPDELRR